MANKSRSRVPSPAALSWPRARQIVQALALVLFLALLIVTRGGQFPSLPPSLFFRLDPLAWLASTIAGRRWVAGVGLALLTLILTLAVGRVWCGWLCPLGTALDLVSPRARTRPQTDPLNHWRSAKYVILIGLLGAALAGNLSLLILDPISLLTRGLASFALPGLNRGVMALERLLYNLEPLQGGLDGFESSIRSWVFPTDVWRWWNLLPGALLIAVLAANWVAPRFWCRYLCPLGALLGWVSRAAFLRRVVGEGACRKCARCARACPTAAIDPAKGYASDPAECVMCMDCLPECATQGGQDWRTVRGLAPFQSYDPARRQALAVLGGGALAAAVYPLAPGQVRRSQQLVRPPGAQGAGFLSACIRCGECLKVCPTSGLQPALWESGLDGVWTPTLAPRLGYCDYSCNACGQVCPTGAIPALALEQKRQQVIGKAEIDRDRCLPWSKQTPCIVCQEMCPLAPKAVELDLFYVTDSDGASMSIQRPHVNRDLCIGCGICEFKCPLPGEAAIRVSSA